MTTLYAMISLKKSLNVILGLFALFLTVSSATAGDLVVSRAMLEDKTGNLSISDVITRQEFKPIGTTLSRGFTDSAYWLRLRVRRPANGNTVVLYIRQPFLNDVRLFEADPGNSTGWKTRVTGNYYPYKDRDRAEKTLGFVVNVTVPETTYYFRLKTRGPSQMSVEALEPPEAERNDYQLDLMEMFFVTSMVLLLLWAIHSYVLDRLRIVGLFALHQAIYTLFGITITGYLAPIIPAGFLPLGDWIASISYCAITFTTLLFCRELFKPYQPPPLMMRGLNLFLLAFPLELLAIVLGFNFFTATLNFAATLNYVLIKVTWWYLVVMVFTLRREQSPSRRTLQLFFVTITIMFTFFWFVNRKETITDQHKLLARQILIANGLIIGGIFTMILNARSRRLQQEAQQSALELKAKSEFLALVSHEIRTPLNALVGFSALARTTKEPAKLDLYHAIIEQSSQSLMELVNDILDMSKFEAGQLEIERAPVNLRQLVENLVAAYRPLATRNKLVFHFDCADAVPVWVMGDAVRLRQILANLLANAVKFTEHGSVSCSVSMIGHSVRFEIKDTGIGIAEEKISQLFQSFNQLDSGISRKFGGTGLGLVIVKNLAEMMNGSIAVTSREGEGSRFTVDLPLAATEAVVSETMPSAIPKAGAFLVVEDNTFNRRLLNDILASWGGRVTLAEDGLQALQLVEEQTFDLILTDVRMPGIDGIEVARRIRLREQERSGMTVPIIAITADADAATREACFGVGINEVLAKPVVPEQLAAAIAACYGGSQPSTPAVKLLLSAKVSSDLGDNPERAKQYQEMLLQDIDDELQQLQGALERGDRAEVGRIAHSLKGLCGHLANGEPAQLAIWLQENAPTASAEKLRSVAEKMLGICEQTGEQP